MQLTGLGYHLQRVGSAASAALRRLKLNETLEVSRATRSQRSQRRLRTGDRLPVVTVRYLATSRRTRSSGE